MYLADYHLHSTASPDSVISPAELCRGALAAGLSELCLTDHWNLATQQGALCLAPYDWSATLAVWREVRAQAGEELELRLGLEAGNGTLAPEAVAATLALPQLDFVIGSIHNLGAAFGHQGAYSAARQVPSRGAAQALVQDYLAQLLALAQTDGYDVLGHLVYPFRYLPAAYGFTLSDFPEETAAILKAAIAKGRGIECNTSMGTTVAPYRWLLGLYRDLGGQILTFGSDAHRPAAIGAALAEAHQLARETGFRYYTLFRRREPCFIRL